MHVLQLRCVFFLAEARGEPTNITKHPDPQQLEDDLDQVDPKVKEVYENMLIKKQEINEKANRTVWDKFQYFVDDKVSILKRRYVFSIYVWKINGYFHY